MNYVTTVKLRLTVKLSQRDPRSQIEIGPIDQSNRKQNLNFLPPYTNL